MDKKASAIMHSVFVPPWICSVVIVNTTNNTQEGGEGPNFSTVHTCTPTNTYTHKQLNTASTVNKTLGRFCELPIGSGARAIYSSLYYKTPQLCFVLFTPVAHSTSTHRQKSYIRESYTYSAALLEFRFGF